MNAVPPLVADAEGSQTAMSVFSPPPLLSVRRRRGEMAIAAAFACAGAGMLRGALDLDLGSVALPAAGFVPAVAGGVLLLSGLWSLFKAGRSSSAEGADREVRLVDRVTGLALIALFLLAALFETLGAPLALGLFIFAMLRLLSPLRLVVCALLAAALAGAMWLFFARLLEASLPAGPF
ncbi:tripartite tricarboxylate transporter TctB family protein [Roseomonas chloroacetimidivorans]|uniref:tripartite tricarboxylate transporter TctB family protein n=1 Tax=Roseomonas chloroacetimidivorans TaxID=1766656 RepID=UPI003C7245C8